MDPVMVQAEFKPMGIGDIFDTTFRMYRRRFATMSLITLVMYVPFAVLMALFVPVLADEAAIEKAVQTGEIWAMILPILLVAFLVMPLCQGALIHNISESYMGRSIGVGESYRRALHRFVPLILTNLLAGIIIVIGFMFLIVPGIIFTLWFMLSTTVVFVESKSLTGALSRSKKLMAGNLDKGLKIFIVIFLLQFAFGFILGMIFFAMTPSPEIQALIENLAGAFVAPLQIAPIILLYYDLRIRKEGFDLEQLAASLERSGEPMETNAASSE